MLDRAKSSSFFSLIQNGTKFRLFLLTKLPAAFFSGIRVIEADEAHCAVSVSYGWFTQNPFKSTYFACLGMAAEMSTGVLAMAHIYKKKPAVSMLIVGSEARFFKKATGKTMFTCKEGQQIKEAVVRAIQSGEGQVVTVSSTGLNAAGEEVAKFTFSWSFKVKLL